MQKLIWIDFVFLWVISSARSPLFPNLVRLRQRTRPRWTLHHHKGSRRWQNQLLGYSIEGKVMDIGTIQIQAARRQLGALISLISSPSPSCTWNRVRMHIPKKLTFANLADDNDVPESLLLESNSASVMEAEVSKPLIPPPRQRPGPDRGPKTHIQWESIDERGTDPAQSSPSNLPFRLQPKNKTSTGIHVTKREAALWRWVNVSNLDNFMRDVYDYYEGGGIWCIMCANALWLL